MNGVFYEAQIVGNSYRGVVVDSSTFENVVVTRHTYPDSTTAICAARRMWMEQEEASA